MKQIIALFAFIIIILFFNTTLYSQVRIDLGINGNPHHVINGSWIIGSTGECILEKNSNRMLLPRHELNNLVEWNVLLDKNLKDTVLFKKLFFGKDILFQDIKFVITNDTSIHTPIIGDQLLRKMGLEYCYKYKDPNFEHYYYLKERRSCRGELIIMQKSYIDDYTEALSAYEKELYSVAIEKYKYLFDKKALGVQGIYEMAECYYREGLYDTAIYYYEIISDKISQKNNIKNYCIIYDNITKKDYYFNLAYSYGKINNCRLAILNYQKCIERSMDGDNLFLLAYTNMAFEYIQLNKEREIRDRLISAINMYLNRNRLNMEDCYAGKNNKQLARALLSLSDIDKNMGNSTLYHNNLILSAAWGDDLAISECKEKKINYLSSSSLEK